MIRITLYFVFLILLSGCGQNDKSIENINSKILFEETKPIQKQLIRSGPTNTERIKNQAAAIKKYLLNPNEI